MSAFENVELPMVIRGKLSRNECKARALELLDSQSRHDACAQRACSRGRKERRASLGPTHVFCTVQCSLPTLPLSAFPPLFTCSSPSGWPAGSLRPSAQRAEWRRAAESVRKKFRTAVQRRPRGLSHVASVWTWCSIVNDACRMCVLLSLPERSPVPWPMSPSCCCSMSPQVRTTSRSAAAAAADEDENGVAAQSHIKRSVGRFRFAHLVNVVAALLRVHQATLTPATPST